MNVWSFCFSKFTPGNIVITCTVIDITLTYCEIIETQNIVTFSVQISLCSCVLHSCNLLQLIKISAAPNYVIREWYVVATGCTEMLMVWPYNVFVFICPPALSHSYARHIVVSLCFHPSSLLVHSCIGPFFWCGWPI